MDYAELYAHKQKERQTTEPEEIPTHFYTNILLLKKESEITDKIQNTDPLNPQSFITKNVKLLTKTIYEDREEKMIRAAKAISRNPQTKQLINLTNFIPEEKQAIEDLATVLSKHKNTIIGAILCQ